MMARDATTKLLMVNSCFEILPFWMKPSCAGSIIPANGVELLFSIFEISIPQSQGTCQNFTQRASTAKI